jgi:hypothetical protein
MILSSRAWQQSSARDAKKEAADPANGLFMRFVPQRLEAEAIRDSMLSRQRRAGCHDVWPRHSR